MLHDLHKIAKSVTKFWIRIKRTDRHVLQTSISPTVINLHLVKVLCTYIGLSSVDSGLDSGVAGGLHVLYEEEYV